MRIRSSGTARWDAPSPRWRRERGHTVHARDRRKRENAAAGADAGAAAGRRRRHRVHPARGRRSANIERLLEAGVPVVTGTTGWDAELPRITALVERRGGALLHAANFSVGVQLFLRAARRPGRGGWPGARSSTPLYWRSITPRSATRPPAPRGLLRARVTRGRSGAAFPITSVRAGAMPGTHLLAYDGPYETDRLSHVARSRDGFAAGALAAAEWLPGHPGVHTFEDMLFGDPDDTPPGLRHRAGHSLHPERRGGLPRPPRAGRLADRRGDRLPGPLRLHRRGPDADDERARAGGGRRSWRWPAAGCRSWPAPPATTPPAPSTRPGECAASARTTSSAPPPTTTSPPRTVSTATSRRWPTPPTRPVCLYNVPGRTAVNLRPAPRSGSRSTPTSSASRKRAAISSRSWRSSAAAPTASRCSRATTGSRCR